MINGLHRPSDDDIQDNSENTANCEMDASDKHDKIAEFKIVAILEKTCCSTCSEKNLDKNLMQNGRQIE